MNILFILPYSPIPTNTGNKNLTFNLLKYIEKKALIDIIIIEEFNNKKNQTYDQLKHNYPNVRDILIFERNKKFKLVLYKLFFLIQGLPPSLGNYYKISILKWLNLNSHKYDLIHFDMFLVTPYINSVKNKPSLLVSSDSYSLAANLALKNINNLKDKIFIYFYMILLQNLEKLFYKKFSKIVCVSNIDKDYLKEYLKIKNITSIGIPISNRLKEREIKHFEKIIQNKSETKLLITGNLNHPIISQNIASFIENILQIILIKYPNLKTIILGKDPTSFLKNIIKNTANVKHINFVNDYFDYLDNDWIYIYPQKCATGLQTKLQQALASGLPVIAYEISYGGLNLTYGKNAFKVHNEKDFLEYIDKLLSNPSLRINLGKNATKYINSNFSIEKIGAKYTKAYKELI